MANNILIRCPDMAVSVDNLLYDGMDRVLTGIELRVPLIPRRYFIV
jgi:hypothetical protein